MVNDTKVRMDIRINKVSQSSHYVTPVQGGKKKSTAIFISDQQDF